jgi:hypothetical protein
VTLEQLVRVADDEVKNTLLEMHLSDDMVRESARNVAEDMVETVVATHMGFEKDPFDRSGKWRLGSKKSVLTESLDVTIKNCVNVYVGENEERIKGIVDKEVEAYLKSAKMKSYVKQMVPELLEKTVDTLIYDQIKHLLGDLPRMGSIEDVLQSVYALAESKEVPEDDGD